MDVATARLEVHDVCLQMVADGLVVGSAGNVSRRVDEDHAVVTAAGVPYGLLTPDEHPLVDLRDGSWSGSRRPTSELAVHLAVLRELPEIGAVVHTHSPYAAGFSVARVPLDFVCNENIGPASERILVTEPYAPPSSEALADAVVRTLARQPGSRACLLANHGPVAIGADLDAAYLVARHVEWVAHVTHVARTVGEVHVLSPDDQDAIGRSYGFTVARER